MKLLAVVAPLVISLVSASVCKCMAIGANNTQLCHGVRSAESCEDHFGRCEWGPSYNKKCYTEALKVENARTVRRKELKSKSKIPEGFMPKLKGLPLLKSHGEPEPKLSHTQEFQHKHWLADQPAQSKMWNQIQNLKVVLSCYSVTITWDKLDTTSHVGPEKNITPIGYQVQAQTGEGKKFSTLHLCPTYSLDSTKCILDFKGLIKLSPGQIVDFLVYAKNQFNQIIPETKSRTIRRRVMCNQAATRSANTEIDKTWTPPKFTPTINEKKPVQPPQVVQDPKQQKIFVVCNESGCESKESQLARDKALVEAERIRQMKIQIEQQEELQRKRRADRQAEIQRRAAREAAAIKAEAKRQARIKEAERVFVICDSTGCNSIARTTTEQKVPQAKALPTKVNNLKCENTNTGGLKLTWTPGSDLKINRAISYLVAEGFLGINQVTKNPQYSLEDKSNHRNYEFIVLAKNSKGFSIQTTIKCVRQRQKPFSQIERVALDAQQVTGISCGDYSRMKYGEINLTWNKIGSASKFYLTGFRLYRQTVQENSFRFYGAKYNSNYTFDISAVYGMTYSFPTKVTCKTPQAPIGEDPVPTPVDTPTAVQPSAQPVDKCKIFIEKATKNQQQVNKLCFEAATWSKDVKTEQQRCDKQGQEANQRNVAQKTACEAAHRSDSQEIPKSRAQEEAEDERREVEERKAAAAERAIKTGSFAKPLVDRRDNIVDNSGPLGAPDAPRDASVPNSSSEGPPGAPDEPAAPSKTEISLPVKPNFGLTPKPSGPESTGSIASGSKRDQTPKPVVKQFRVSDICHKPTSCSSSTFVSELDCQIFKEQQKLRMDPQTWWAKVLDLGDKTQDITRKETLKQISNKIGLQVVKCKQNPKQCSLRKPLVWSDGLALAAREHCVDWKSKDIQNHQSTTGQSEQDRIRSYSEQQTNQPLVVGENMAFGKFKVKSLEQHAFNILLDMMTKHELKRDMSEVKHYSKHIWSTDFQKSGVSSCIDKQPKGKVRQLEMTVIQYASEGFSLNQMAKNQIQILREACYFESGRKLGSLVDKSPLLQFFYSNEEAALPYLVGAMGLTSLLAL